MAGDLTSVSQRSTGRGRVARLIRRIFWRHDPHQTPLATGDQPDFERCPGDSNRRGLYALEYLEPRLLLSADPMPLVVPDDVVAESDEAALVQNIDDDNTVRAAEAADKQDGPAETAPAATPLVDWGGGGEAGFGSAEPSGAEAAPETAMSTARPEAGLAAADSSAEAGARAAKTPAESAQDGQRTLPDTSDRGGAGEAQPGSSRAAEPLPDGGSAAGGAGAAGSPPDPGSQGAASGATGSGFGQPIRAAAAPEQPAGEAIGAQDVDPVFDAAIDRLKADGRFADQADRLRTATYELVDLPGLTLAQAHDTRVLIDPSAAGYGWYVDPTPEDDAEFTATVEGGLTAEPGTAAQDRIDLYTALLHELGHVVGLDDLDPAAHSGEVMVATLFAGVRRTGLSVSSGMERTVLSFGAAASGGAFTLVRNGELIELRDHNTGQVVAAQPAAGLGAVVVQGADRADDSLAIDFSGGTIAAPVTFHGGLPASTS